MLLIKNEGLYCTTHKRYCDETCKKYCAKYRDCASCKHMNTPFNCEPCIYCYRTEERINWEESNNEENHN